MHSTMTKGFDIFLLTGCTAVGKTELAIRWAEEMDAEILSADSLLFYRGMNIGTAKPTQAERSRVRHHLIDVAPVSDQWDISRYIKAAQTAVAEITARGRRVLVTGGSGFYLKSFWAPVIDQLSIPDSVREQVARLHNQGIGAMVKKLREMNPEGLGNLDTKNPRRVSKALERCLASGLTIQELRRRHEAGPSAFSGSRVHITLLQRNPDDLRHRITARVASMLEDGLIDEVRALLNEGIEKNPSAANAIGYRETIRFLKGDLSREALADEIIHNTNRLVRKQRTWFRYQLPPHARVIDLSCANSINPGELFSTPGS